jgi:tight adherence protein B
MIPNSVILAVLGLLLFAAVISLWLDARERRMNRQLAIALAEAPTVSSTSIRRTETGSSSTFLYRLVNYNPHVVYAWHPIYVLLAAMLAASVLFYANRLFGFSTTDVSIAAVIVAFLVVRGLFGWQRLRFADQLFRQLPDTIQLVTSTVRSGLPVNEAFRTIAREMPQPTAGQFALVCSEMSLGKTPEEAVESVYRRTKVAEYAMFSVTLAVQLRSGGSLAETLQILAETVSQRVALAGRAKALAGEVIFSSRALSLSPIIIGGLMWWVNPQSIDLLFFDPTGNMLLAYAAGSVLLGHFVIRWMIRKETAL